MESNEFDSIDINSPLIMEMKGIIQKISNRKARSISRRFTQKFMLSRKKIEKRKKSEKQQEANKKLEEGYEDDPIFKFGSSDAAIEYMKTDYIKGKSQKVMVKKLPRHIPLPPLSTWSSTHRNFLNEAPAKFIPYIGDDFVEKDFIEENQELMLKLQHEAEIDFNCVLSLFKVMLHFTDLTQEYQAQYPILLKFFNTIEPLSSKDRIMKVCDVVQKFVGFYNTNQLMLRIYDFNFERKGKLQDFCQTVEESAIPSIDANTTVKFSLETEFKSSYMNFFCPSCLVYDCYSHNSSTCFVKKQNLEDPVEKAARVIKKPCGESCYMHNAQALRRARYVCNWKVPDINFFLALTQTFKDNFCRISQIMGKPCSEVFQHSNNRDDGDSLPTYIKKNLNKKSNKKMKTKDGEVCNCKGVCNAKLCPCYSNYRECNPEACHCHNLRNENETTCQNNSIQYGKRKKLLLGTSDIAGWGIFINEQVEPGETISEYCGETIPQYEGDKRGRLYDNKTSSFLFNLHEKSDLLVDAYHLGNKIRFANHSCPMCANCVARIVQVNGVPRIKIQAKFALEKFEELFFDYQYGQNDRLRFTNIDLNFPLPKIHCPLYLSAYRAK